jgi:hypothetical protein
MHGQAVDLNAWSNAASVFVATNKAEAYVVNIPNLFLRFQSAP